MLKVDQNRLGDCLGDFIRVRVVLVVFHPLRWLLKVRLPNGSRVDVELLYERLPAYCFMCGCFDHVGLGLHLYSGKVIEADKTTYGSWLQAEVKRANIRNLRGRRFRLEKEEEFVDSDVEQLPVNAHPPSPGVARVSVTEEVNLDNLENTRISPEYWALHSNQALSVGISVDP